MRAKRLGGSFSRAGDEVRRKGQKLSQKQAAWCTVTHQLWSTRPFYFLRLPLSRSSVLVSCQTSGHSGHILLHVSPEFSIEITLY